MAGQGRKTFSDGEVLSAADVNGYLMDQSVMRFADSTARTAAIGTPTEGMVSYLDDTNDVEVFDGSSWVNFTGDITNITAGTGLTGGGSEGAVTLDVDFTAVQENVITTQGDLIIGDASGDPVRLPVGSADQVLTSDGTTVSFQDAGGGASTGIELIDSGSIGSGGSSTSIDFGIEYILKPDLNKIIIVFDILKPDTDPATVDMQLRNGSSIPISFEKGTGLEISSNGANSYILSKRFISPNTTTEIFKTDISSNSGYATIVLDGVNTDAGDFVYVNYVASVDDATGTRSSLGQFLLQKSVSNRVEEIVLSLNTGSWSNGQYYIYGA